MQEKLTQPAGAVGTGVFDRLSAQYLLVLVGFLALYSVTCAPAVLWQDSGLFVYRILHNDIEGNLGLALAHPLYILIGMAVKSIGVGDLAHRINLMSAAFGAIATANLFLLVRLWLGSVLPAVIAAITLGLSWNFWQHAVVAEAYTLYAAQLLAELVVLLKYVQTKRTGYLYLLALLNGLAVANHLWGLIALACYAVFLLLLLGRRRIGLKHLGMFVFLWVLGAAPYEYLILKNIASSGDVQGTLASALFGNLWRGAVLNQSISLKLVCENIVFILLNFPTPNIILLAVGLWVVLKKVPSSEFAAVVVAMSVLYFVFAFRYTVPDRHVFFLPFYCFGAVLVGVGADRVLQRHASRGLALCLLAFALLPAPAYTATPRLAKAVYPSLGQRRQRPYRDEYDYFLQPWKTGYRGAARFAAEALGEVEQDATIYAYTTDVHALLYMQQVKGMRQDVSIVSDHDHSAGARAITEETVADLIRSSALYVTSPVKGYCPEFLRERYDFVKEDMLWRVVERGRSEAGSAASSG